MTAAVAVDVRSDAATCVIPDAGLTAVARFTWHNPMLAVTGRGVSLDVAEPPSPMTPLAISRTSSDRFAAIFGTHGPGTQGLPQVTAGGGPLLTPDAAHPANLVSSLCVDGHHRPALDVDAFGDDIDRAVAACAEILRVEPGSLVAVRSTSNVHVYCPTLKFQHDEYFLLLEELRFRSVIETGYLEASRSRGQTLLRPPNVEKLSGPPRCRNCGSATSTPCTTCSECDPEGSLT